MNKKSPVPLNENRPLCGVVVYEISEGTLHGKWTVNNSKYIGTIGREVATGGKPGVLEGDYDVEIFHGDTDDEKRIYQGKLKITGLGATYQLEWSSPTGNYSGLGLLTGDNMLVANYWNE